MLRTLASLSILAATPAFGRGAAVYPLSGTVAPQQIDDVEGDLKAALLRRRSGALTTTATESLSPACGKAPQAACLMRLAHGGVVLTGVVRPAGKLLELSLTAVDAQARVYGPAVVKVVPGGGSLEPYTAALDSLESAVIAGARPPPPAPPKAVAAAPAAPAPTPAPAAPAPAAPAPAAPAPAAPAPSRPPAPAAAVAAARVPPRPAGAWMEPAGKWASLGGVVAIAGGATLGLLGNHLNDQLTSKYQSNTLAASDASSYSRLHSMAVGANVLFIAGGVALLTGLTLWGLAPDAEEGGY